MQMPAVNCGAAGLRRSQSLTGVAGDAVAIEPVSASQFPANREKNREFANFGAVSRHQMTREPNDLRAFRPNSLVNGSGTFWWKNREYLTRIREFPPLSRGYIPADGQAQSQSVQSPNVRFYAAHFPTRGLLPQAACSANQVLPNFL